MRLHTNTLTEHDVRAAATVAGVGLYRLTRHGSRKRDHAFEVIIEGSGRTGTRYGQNRDMIAATWDEWGIFLADLFRRDDTLTIPRVYENRSAFRWATDDRFDTLTPDAQHVRHRWNHGGAAGAAHNAYVIAWCKCGATTRRHIGATLGVA